MTRDILICATLALAFGLFSETTYAQNAQCTLLSGTNFGQAVPVTINPAPPANAPCQVGSDSGYVSRTPSGVGLNFNAVCTIVAFGHTLALPYEGNSAPVVGAPCQIGNVNGYVSSTSAKTSATAECTPFSGPYAGQPMAFSGTPAPALNAPCKIGNDSGYISRTSGPIGDVNAMCTVNVTGRTLTVPYSGNPAPAIDAPCQVANLGGYISGTSGPSSNVNAQCTVVTPSLSQTTPGVGSAVPYYANPAPPLDASCKVGLDVGFVSSTSRPGPPANSVCTIVYNGVTIQAPYYVNPALPINSSCTVGNGYHGKITSSIAAWTPGSLPFDLVWLAGSDGSVLSSGVDANGLPLNPRWFPQMQDPTNQKNNPDFSACGSGWGNCSTQNPQGDGYTGYWSSFSVCKESGTVWPGHVNFRNVTYTGNLIYEDYSSTSGCAQAVVDNFFPPQPWNYKELGACGQDHDLNFGLTRGGDYSGLTTSYTTYSKQDGWGDSSGPALHLEFNGDETSWFGSPWWQKFRNWAQSDNRYRGFNYVTGVPAIVTGLLGIDAVHDGGSTELHPVFSMALHDAGDDPDFWFMNPVGDLQVVQNWHFFIMNWGSEGTCSHLPHYWSGNNYKIQFPWAVNGGTSAAKVNVFPGTAYSYHSEGSYFMPDPEYEVHEGGWVTLEFFMPPVKSGWDGNITLQYTFPAGFKRAPQVRAATKPNPKSIPHAENEINWSQVIPRVTDPALRAQLRRSLERLAPPPVPANRSAVTIRAKAEPLKIQPSEPPAAPAGRCAPTYPARPATQGARVLTITSAQSAAEGAQVFLDGQCQGTIRAEGTGYSLMLENIPSNRAYVVSVRKPGFRPFEQQITVPPSAVPYASSPKIVVTFVLSPQ